MISFAVRAPDEATFWASWVDAGICTGPHEYTPDYAGCVWVNDWGSGVIPEKDGWFANVYVSGQIEQAMVAGRPQTDEQGQPLGVFDRTWATLVFSLAWRDRDETTNFPPGYANAAGIYYADTADIATPHNVRQ